MRTGTDALRASPQWGPPLSVESLGRWQRRRLWLVIAGLLALTLIGCLLLRMQINAILVGGLLVLSVAVPAFLGWLWRQPVRTVYVLFGAAVVAPSTAPLDPKSIDNVLPVFLQITSWTGVHVIVSLAEIFMAVAVLVWLLKRGAERRLAFKSGSLMLPIGLYMLMVLVGEIHGLGTGGDFRLSLWEVRAQIYMFIAYVLACNLITRRAQLNTLLWILVLGAGVNAVDGTVRYLLYIRGTGNGDFLFPHEQAFFFNCLLTLTPIVFLYGGSRRLKTAALLILPLALFADFATQRRAAILALGVAALLLLVLTLILNPAHRRLAAFALIAIAVVFPPYYSIYQHRGGIIAEPARAIASNFNPDPRDLSSNQYRINEDADILVNMHLSPVIGIGFGKLMWTPYPLANISQQYEFWNLLPHNSVLWVWMRTGTIGYVLFWIMIGSAISGAVAAMRRLRELYWRGLMVFVLLMVIQEVIFGYLDLQWTNYRNLIFVGILFALIGRIPALAARVTVAPVESEQSADTGSALGSETVAARLLSVSDM